MILKLIRVKSHLRELTNCYIVMDEDTKETMVIDPGGEPDKIIEMLNILDAKVKYIYNNTVQINGGSICDLNVEYEYIRKIRRAC